MPRIYQFLNLFRPKNRIQQSLLVGILLWILWFAGYLDFLNESDFKYFRWPPYVNVRYQIVQELTGSQSEFIHYNRWSDFRSLAQPTCKKNWLTRKRSILVIIKTAPDRFERRSAYRKTLSSVRQLNSYRIRIVFVLGYNPTDGFNGSSLQTEAAAYNDMLVGDFEDAYFNNTFKFVYSLKLARWHCFPGNNVIPFLVLLDDDYILKMENLVSLVNKHQPNEQLYMGQRVDTTPFRLNFQKFRVSIEEYPFNMFPPYITGGCVLFSPQAVREFYLAVQYLKMFRLDDVYSGIIAYVLGYDVQSNPYILSDKHPYISWDMKIAEHGYSSDDIANSFSITNSTSHTLKG